LIVLQVLFGCLAFVNLAENGGDVFTWLLSLSGLSILFIYGSIALAHIRFRRAWAANGHSVDELPFKAAFGVWGSWVCLIVNVLALIAQFYGRCTQAAVPTWILQHGFNPTWPVLSSSFYI